MIERHRALDHPVHGIWLATLADTGQALGNLLLKPACAASSGERHPPVEIGWHLHPDAQGHGFATEAAEAVLADAAARGLDSVVALVHPENHSSQRVCARLGFYERVAPASLRDENTLCFEKLLSR